MNTKTTSTVYAGMTFEEDLAFTCRDLNAQFTLWVDKAMKREIGALLKRHPLTTWGTPDMTGKIEAQLKTALEEAHRWLSEEWGVAHADAKQ
jgi:hypothetical protein